MPPHLQYEASGLLSQYLTQTGASTWYQMSDLSCTQFDELVGYGAVEPSGVAPHVRIGA